MVSWLIVTEIHWPHFDILKAISLRPWNDLKWDSESAKIKNAFDFEYWSDPIFLNGDYPEIVKNILFDLNIHLPKFTPDEIKANAGAADFLGVNHYMNRVNNKYFISPIGKLAYYMLLLLSHIIHANDILA